VVPFLRNEALLQFWHQILFNACRNLSVKDADELRSVVQDNFDLISECGFTKPTTRLDKVTLVQSVALHQVILRTLGELSQFRDGLETIGVARAIEQNSAFLQEFFVKKSSRVTAGVSKYTLRVS